MGKPEAILQTDLKAGYLAHKTGIDAAIARALDSGWYILGKEVAGFEEAFAAYVGVGHAVGVASGTDAVELALRACGVGPGDLVFTVSHTAVATVAAVEATGASTVFVDIDPVSFTLDPGSLEQAIAACLERPPFPGARPKAVLPVHLYGQAASMNEILEIARRNSLSVIEDCAQAHGAEHEGRRVGGLGRLGAFSFYPTKNLGALGDGGAVVTGDAGLAERVRTLRQYGWRERYVSDEPGMNSRLDELQAAILGVRLGRLDESNRRRQAIAGIYDAGLAGTGLLLPKVHPGRVHVYHQYVVRSKERDALRERLRVDGIGTLIHYPVPVHLQPAYRDRVARLVPLGHTESAAGEILSLPMYSELSTAQAERVVRSVATCAAGRGA